MAFVSRRFSNNEKLQAAANNNPPLKKGSTGAAVEVLQRALIDLGFAMPISTAQSSKLADGIYGDETARTVRNFQAQQGLQQDGIAGRITLGRLDTLIAAAEELELASLTLQSRGFFVTTARLGQ